MDGYECWKDGGLKIAFVVEREADAMTWVPWAQISNTLDASLDAAMQMYPHLKFQVPDSMAIYGYAGPRHLTTNRSVRQGGLIYRYTVIVANGCDAIVRRCPDQVN